jgi:hypothetical protein
VPDRGVCSEGHGLLLDGPQVEIRPSNVARIVTSLISSRAVSNEEILVEPELRLRRSTAPAPSGA